jgi:hypothetical protein
MAAATKNCELRELEEGGEKVEHARRTQPTWYLGFNDPSQKGRNSPSPLLLLPARKLVLGYFFCSNKKYELKDGEGWSIPGIMG